MYFEVSVCRSNRIFEAETRVFQGIHKPRGTGSSPVAAISFHRQNEAHSLQRVVDLIEMGDRRYEGMFQVDVGLPILRIFRFAGLAQLRDGVQTHPESGSVL